MSEKIKLIKKYVENLKNNANTITGLGINSLTGYLLACNDMIAYISSIDSDREKKDYHKRYENIAQSDYFKSSYCDKSLGKEESCFESCTSIDDDLDQNRKHNTNNKEKLIHKINEQ